MTYITVVRSGCRSFVSLTLGLTLGITCLISIAPAAAAQYSSELPDFYTPPASIPAPGEVIRAQGAPLLLTLPGLDGPWPASAQRVLYSSLTQHNVPTAVSGSLLEPNGPWLGSGPRPTVVVGSGTIGQGDQCAPSRNLTLPVKVDLETASVPLNYEYLLAHVFTAQGVRVFMPDYIGLGTPGIHTYFNRIEEGHAMIDGARAALKLAGVPESSPIGFWGGSQGGGAAASAAELAATYGAGLNVVGSYVGAPPADLRATLDRIDGTAIVASIDYTLNGLAARYPGLQQYLDRYLNAKGRQVLESVATRCVADSIGLVGFQHTNTWTKTGESLGEIFAREPELTQILEEHRIGKMRPNAPVYLTGDINDDLIPIGQVRQLASDWCAQGGAVQLNVSALPPVLPGSGTAHVLLALINTLPASTYLVDRFNGRPTPDNCGG